MKGKAKSVSIHDGREFPVGRIHRSQHNGIYCLNRIIEYLMLIIQQKTRVGTFSREYTVRGASSPLFR